MFAETQEPQLAAFFLFLFIYFVVVVFFFQLIGTNKIRDPHAYVRVSYL